MKLRHLVSTSLAAAALLGAMASPSQATHYSLNGPSNSFWDFSHTFTADGCPDTLLNSQLNGSDALVVNIQGRTSLTVAWTAADKPVVDAVYQNGHIAGLVASFIDGRCIPLASGKVSTNASPWTFPVPATAKYVVFTTTAGVGLGLDF